MADNKEMVTEFRGIIDAVINKQARGANPTWPGIDQLAEYAGISYVSVDARHSRISPVGTGEEHRWAIVRRLQIAQFGVGQIALVSLAGNNEQLLRRVSVRGAFSEVDTEKSLSETSDIEAALQYARYPHIHSDNLNKLAELDGDEYARISETVSRQREGQRQLREDLHAISQAQATAYELTRYTWLD